MTWDFAEVNFFSESVGSIETVLKTLSVSLTYLSSSRHRGHVQQADAQPRELLRREPPHVEPPERVVQRILGQRLLVGP